ncbi:MAG: bifunctional glutamate N-acetyltransferase/amino-acid acetyltransferase ArgJ [Pseudomonadota bacterium]
MAVADNTLTPLLPVPGVRLAAVTAGIKQTQRADLVLMELPESAVTAAVFTRNAFCAAPVLLAKEHLQRSDNKVRYLLINAGNANAGTGVTGLEDARRTTQAVAEIASCEAEAVLPFSTGVIGEALPVDKIEAVLPEAYRALDARAWPDAAAGIMTTDTRPKGCSRTFVIDDKEYVITGIAKGAGMVRPNMATMLAYIATDMAVEQTLLQGILDEAIEKSFNRITVDGDTSTNDACVFVATGLADAKPMTAEQTERAKQFQDVVEEICIHLAQSLVRDGEGASKFVTVTVNGGLGERECLDVAYTIAHSPLVKTALFASDPNWGRLLAAIGRSGLDDLDVDLVDLYLNDVLIAAKGARAQHYSEEQGVAAMAPEDITIRIELNRGDHTASVWTTDLSYDYVKINAEYRT